jgi:hypothetical protein
MGLMSLHKGAIALVFAGGVLLAGCEGARESIAGAIRPASAQDVAAAVHQKAGEGKFKEAHDEGAAFLAKRDDAGGAVAWETAKASAQAGLADEAVRLATLAVQARAVSGVDLMAEPALAPVHTDARIVALAAGMAAPAAAAVSAPVTAAAGAVQATVGAGGVKASAGDVSVELPN